MTERDLEIAAYNIKLPLDFYAIPLREDPDLDNVRWARGIVDEVLAQAEAPTELAGIVEELAELRWRLLASSSPLLTAAVSIRPAGAMTIGCLLTAEQFSMEPGDGPDSFEVMLTEGVRQLRPGARTRLAEAWRTKTEMGEIVGLLHRIDYIELGAGEGTLEQRTIFGVFPLRSREMVRFIFTVSDFATFPNMKVDTQAIVETIQVSLSGGTP